MCQKAKQPFTHPHLNFIQLPLSIMILSIKEIVFIQNNLQNLKWKYWHRKNLWYKYKTRQHLHALWHKYNSQKPRSIKTFNTFEEHVYKIWSSISWNDPETYYKNRGERNKKFKWRNALENYYKRHPERIEELKYWEEVRQKYA